MWIEVITTAHELGLPTSATMMYGHVDTPAHWVGHLRVIRSIQERTGGFTEFVLLPFIHENAPIYLAGLARPGPTRRENRAVHALSRLLLHGAIDSIQCSWVKLGDDGCRDVLRGGANDLGGTLMEETISRMAGADHGSYKTISGLRAITESLGRPAAPAHHHLRRGPGRAPGRRRSHQRRLLIRAHRPAPADALTPRVVRPGVARAGGLCSRWPQACRGLTRPGRVVRGCAGSWSCSCSTPSLSRPG